MQQMDPRETVQTQAGYGYTGDAQYDSASGSQKLNVDDDDQFADILTRKIKAELKNEMKTGKEATIGYRLALAIVSVCILVPLFVALVVGLALGVGGPALSWGFVGACAVIFVVNAYFNWASIEISRHQR